MKNYFFIIFIIGFLCCPFLGLSQNSVLPESRSGDIQELSIYPNPVEGGKVYITSKQNLTKDIVIFDVLGKKILETSLFGKELNISRLPIGIYILKIQEGGKSTTRKLVIR